MTEKDYNPEQKAMKSMKKMKKAEKAKVETPKVSGKTETPKESNVSESKKPEVQENKAKEEKTTESKSESKKPAEKKPEVKKDFAIVNVPNLPISTKKSRDFCRFVRGKNIEVAINDMEQVKKMKIAVPAKGEVSHQKGKGMAGGIYATKTAEQFLVLLKSLLANANNAGLEKPIVSEAIANIGQRPYSRFGRMRKKRTHIKLVAREAKVRKGKTKKTKKKIENKEKKK